MQSHFQFNSLATGGDTPSAVFELLPMGDSKKDKKRKYDKDYRENKREERRAYMADPKRIKRWNKMRREKYLKTRSKPRVPLTPEQRIAHKRQSWNQYRERCKAYPDKMLIRNMRTRVAQILRGKVVKSETTSKLIGCTTKNLMDHLERQFKDGMTWHNYGKAGWEVDHIWPCSKWDLADPIQRSLCFHYTNLQPLWMVDNVRKGNRG